jgi:hypothetical protein
MKVARGWGKALPEDPYGWPFFPANHIFLSCFEEEKQLKTGLFSLCKNEERAFTKNLTLYY